MAKEASLLLRIKTAGAEALDSLADKFDVIKQAGTIAFTALSAVLIKSISEFKEQEAASNALTQAMINNGVYSKDLKKSYEEQATAVSKLTLYAGDQVTAAQAALQMQIGEKEISKELTMAIADLATAKKMDLVSAAQLVGKTINGTNNVLEKQGVHFDNNTTGAERMSAVIGGLNAAMGGQAVAATSGLGAMGQLVNSFNDIFEAIGARLAPAIGVLTRALNSFTNDASNTAPIVDALVFVFESGIRIATLFGYAFQSLGATIGTAIGAIAGSIEQLTEGNFKNAKDALINGFGDIAKERARIQANSDATMLELDAAFSQKQADNQAGEEQKLIATLEKKKELAILKKQEENLALQEQEIANQEMNLALMDLSETQKTEKELSFLEKRLANASSHQEKMTLLEQKSNLLRSLEKQKHDEKEAENQKKIDEEKIKNREATLSKISTLQSSNNSLLAAAGKAAALTQIAIETPVAISKALSAFPPPFSFAAAGLVGAAMATQAAQVAGVQLAEGGIVTARPGGIQATIGEGGQDEAVIPLDRAGEFGLGGGGGITINVYGGMLGDESSAHQFAKVIDQQLLKLRQNNESVAFDGGIV